MRPATMADVAAVAGVSVSTVSHVINGTRAVSASARERVEEAIRERGYSPNAIARSLAMADTHLIGIVMSALTNPYFVPVVAAIDRAGRRHGYSSVLADSRDQADREAEAVYMLLSRRVDGVILAPTGGDRHSVLDMLSEKRVPTVLIDRFADDRFDQVGVENVEATSRLVEHLASLGHSKIAFVSGLRTLSTSVERLNGYRLGLERSGLIFDRELVCHGRSSTSQAERAVTTLLSDGPRPTAIVSGNNSMTVGVLQALQLKKLRVPDDMALAAFDDLDLAGVFQPRLTVISQPVNEIATDAVELLIRRMHTKADELRPPRSIEVPGTFIHRNSCGCTG